MLLKLINRLIIIIVYFTPNSKISYTEVQVSNENGVKIAHMQKVAVYKVAPLGRIGETKLKIEASQFELDIRIYRVSQKERLSFFLIRKIQ